MIVVTMLIVVMVIGSVSAVPNIKIEKDRDLNNFLSSIDFTVLKRLTNKLIDIVGSDVYNKTLFNVKMLFYDYAQIDANTYKFNITTKERTNVIDWLTDIAVFIILLTYALIGHNGGSQGVAFLLSTVMLCIPCFCVGLLYTLPFTIENIMSNLQIVPSDILYEYGILGFLGLLIIIMPIVLLISLFVYPIMVGVYTLDMLYCIITNAFSQCEDLII